MPDADIVQMLELLRAGESAVWDQFLGEYAPLIYQVVRHFEPDGDRAADAFQHVCEQLIKDRFHRLGKFDPRGPALFSTWLRAVVRNLCLDRRRKEVGRLRPFRSIARLSAVDQAVFLQVYERGATIEEAASILTTDFPRLTPDAVGESIQRIEKALTGGQRWRLGLRPEHPSDRSLAAGGEGVPHETTDPRPGPEAEAIKREQQAALGRALERLSQRERLLIRLRFEEGMTLEQIARLLALGNAQRADRQVKEVLMRLREAMGPAPGKKSRGKRSGVSVKVFGKRPV